ncbi:UNVERIFIED_CONTAM: hypothetical protein Sangu_2660700 [Sesamum angustifolium]|uniref:Retrotransposon gag domain-containing protein n=1 Tax=Sesamum angustifolium TaxID=2727405 RepID=A0AAW2J1L7_9LAMI
MNALWRKNFLLTFEHLHTYLLTMVPLIQFNKFVSLKTQHCSTEFSSLFQHQFASSKKYKKSTISLFGIKQEEKETLRAYVQYFNATILEIPTAHQEVIVSAFTLHGGPLIESLAKKPAIDFLDVLAQAEKYMNLEDAWLVKKNEHDKRKENKLISLQEKRLLATM